jgi:hypothetical protein
MVHATLKPSPLFADTVENVRSGAIVERRFQIRMGDNAEYIRYFRGGA